MVQTPIALLQGARLVQGVRLVYMHANCTPVASMKYHALGLSECASSSAAEQRKLAGLRQCLAAAAKFAW